MNAVACAASPWLASAIIALPHIPVIRLDGESTFHRLQRFPVMPRIAKQVTSLARQLSISGIERHRAFKLFDRRHPVAEAPANRPNGNRDVRIVWQKFPRPRILSYPWRS